MKQIVFTDLDGTLLDRETYSWEAARPALERLQRREIPLIFVSSKTRAEVEWWRKQMGNQHPFIVESGSAAYVPRGYFSFRIPGAHQRGKYQVLEWGKPYKYLVTRLKRASRRSRCRVRGFSNMNAAQISRSCGLPLEQAKLAKLREYDEPFLILDAGRGDQLLESIEEQGLHWNKGGRFCHITGETDKAVAVIQVQRLFERAYGAVETIGLGDAEADAPFLKIVSTAVLVRSSHSAQLAAAVPGGMLTGKPGPQGWNEAVLKLIRG
jgi:mannosyl-3-phosphoglycerate phosphatase family protein